MILELVERFSNLYDNIMARATNYLATEANPILLVVGYAALIGIFLTNMDEVVSFAMEMALLSFTVGMLGLMAGSNLEKPDKIKQGFIESSRMFIYSGILTIFYMFLAFVVNEGTALGYETIDKIFSASMEVMLVVVLSSAAAAFTVGILKLLNTTYEMKEE